LQEAQVMVEDADYDLPSENKQGKTQFILI
jgi:hypothetical protein